MLSWLNQTRLIFLSSQNSKLNNQEFFRRHASKLKQIELAGSFSLDEWDDFIQCDLTYRQALKFIRQDLGIKNIRVGIRWDKVEISADKLDLGKYKDFLQTCMDLNFDICLNIGPIKVFRWPEQYVPEFVFEEVKQRIGQNTLVDTNSYLAKKAFEYENRLCQILVKNFSKFDLNKIKIIQTDNEPFKSFGKYGWTFTPKYISETIKIASAYFPHSAFLVTSSGLSNLRHFIEVHNDLGQDCSLVFGINYYHVFDGYKSRPWQKLYDDFNKSVINPTSSKVLKNAIRSYGFDAEIVEAQFEPWGSASSPGNSAQDLRFVLSRVLNFGGLDFENPERKKLVRLWGIEKFIAAFHSKEKTQEHEQIIELIQMIQQNKSG